MYWDLNRSNFDTVQTTLKWNFWFEICFGGYLKWGMDKEWQLDTGTLCVPSECVYQNVRRGICVCVCVVSVEDTVTACLSLYATEKHELLIGLKFDTTQRETDVQMHT